MKKRTISNLIMVLVIAALAVGGALLVLREKNDDPTALGSRFQRTEIGADALVEEGKQTCTVSIVCDTVLAHLDVLEEGKAPYLPEDAVILPETEVSFSEEDTAFTVLQRVCAAADIPLEYSWTPLYDSYYIEGIGHLYEFDCGSASGWMFEINGRFPEQGSSSCALQDGDEIVWCYTCVGLGEDVSGGDGT